MTRHNKTWHDMTHLVEIPGGDVEILSDLFQSSRQLHDLLISGLDDFLKRLDLGVQVLDFVVQVLFFLCRAEGDYSNYEEEDI